jgi:molybdopterin/thiamine biosynthesis adenylyltransferase
LLLDAHMFFAGLGSVSRPAARRLAAEWARHFTFADPKTYLPKSVASQCAEAEVGQSKVEAGRRELKDRYGVEAVVYPCDLYSVVDGAVEPETTVIAGVDNWRADIGANRLALRMGARLVKVNVEPLYETLAVRCYDYRRPNGICAECQFSDAHYNAQKHPRSCDGTGVRATGSTRALGEAAGLAAAVAAIELLDESKAGRWLGVEFQFSPRGGPVWSRLSHNDQCRCDHQARWRSLQRLASGPQIISLAELVRSAEVLLGRAETARFCKQVAMQSRCRQCGHAVCAPRWFCEWEAGTGDCPRCGDRLMAVPFYVHSELPLEKLAAVAGAPLADWGVAAGAVIELAAGAARQAFVVGSARPLTPRTKAHEPLLEAVS